MIITEPSAILPTRFYVATAAGAGGSLGAPASRRPDREDFPAGRRVRRGQRSRAADSGSTATGVGGSGPEGRRSGFGAPPPGPKKPTLPRPGGGTHPPGRTTRSFQNR